MSNIIDEMVDLFNNEAPIARLFGMTIEFDDEDNAFLTLPFNPNLNHAFGGIHGGVYATMLDTVGWFTVAVRMDEPKRLLVTTEMSMHFLLPLKNQELRAYGKMIKKGSQQSVAEMFLYDEDNKLAGHATGTFMQLPDKE